MYVRTRAVVVGSVVNIITGDVQCWKCAARRLVSQYHAFIRTRESIINVRDWFIYASVTAISVFCASVILSRLIGSVR